MADVWIRPADDVRDLAEAAFQQHRRVVLALLPGAEVEHVGATAVPGALTKGDVDVLVRVGEDDFPAAVDVLSDVYPIHQPHNWTPTLASFKAKEPAELEVGVQLVVAGSDADRWFGPFRDALIDSPALLAQYNQLKQRLDGLDYARYTELKGEFVERVLRQSSTPETGRPSSR
jgi:GrpB-like predicted nucleotidyltransferase (UPF0157 family)